MKLPEGCGSLVSPSFPTRRFRPGGGATRLIHSGIGSNSFRTATDSDRNDFGPFAEIPHSSVFKPVRRFLIPGAILAVVACLALALLRPSTWVVFRGGWKPYTCRYQHAETTGLMDTILLADGTLAIIRFAPDSDASALAALEHVVSGMIFGTSRDNETFGTAPFRQNITLHGEISKRTSHDFEDDYYWFRLEAWTLETPFDVQVWRKDREFEDPLEARSCATFAEAGVEDPMVDGRVVPLAPFLIRRP